MAKKTTKRTAADTADADTAIAPPADSGKGNADVRVESWMPSILIVVSVMVLKYMQRSGRGAELYEACQHYFFPASPDPAM